MGTLGQLSQLIFASLSYDAFRSTRIGITPPLMTRTSSSGNGRCRRKAWTSLSAVTPRTTWFICIHLLCQFMDNSSAFPASLLEQAHQVAAARGGIAHRPPRRERPAHQQPGRSRGTERTGPGCQIDPCAGTGPAANRARGRRTGTLAFDTVKRRRPLSRASSRPRTSGAAHRGCAS
jgi:hypothetical protein